jgi:glycosyltransferase involved in cell wall biosynthesis
MSQPLVSVICLCYNHSGFVREAIESVLAQTHTRVQLIVVDDASTDSSARVIHQLKQEYPSIEILLLTNNVGNCKAFNLGLELAKGEYFIDLAADDVLLPNRIEVGITSLQQAGNEYGVHFSDADIILSNGVHLTFHSTRFPHTSIPQGDIYKNLIERYFICPPTIMFTKAVVEYTQGYDETLSYEDFDFWIRSSRKFKYIYSPQVLVKKREAARALAKKQFEIFSKHSLSTFKVCEKILELNRTSEEKKALTNRVFYEIKLNLKLLNIDVMVRYFFLLLRNLG